MLWIHLITNIYIYIYIYICISISYSNRHIIRVSCFVVTSVVGSRTNSMRIYARHFDENISPISSPAPYPNHFYSDIIGAYNPKKGGDAKIAISIFECQGNNNSRETCLHLEKQRFVANHTGNGLGWIFPEHILDMKSTGLWIGMSVMEFMTNNTILIELLVFLHDRGFPKMAILWWQK